MVLLRVHPAERRLEEWALVLASMGVSSRIESGETGYHLLVADDDFARAQDALRSFEDENKPVPVVPVVEYGPSLLGWFVALALLAFFVVTGDRSGSPWFARGSADAAPAPGTDRPRSQLGPHDGDRRRDGQADHQ